MAPKADAELIDDLGYNETPAPNDAEPPIDIQATMLTLLAIIIVCLIALVIHGVLDRKRQLTAPPTSPRHSRPSETNPQLTDHPDDQDRR